MGTRPKSFFKGSDETPYNDCDVCLSNGKTEDAISYCTTCCENLCQACDLSHRGSRASRGHTILSGSNVPSGTTKTKPTLPFVFCDAHKTTLLNIYCTTHDEVICQACKMTVHKTCNTGDASRHSAQLDAEKELKKVAKSLGDLTTRYEDLTKNRRLDKSNVQIQIKKCFSDMHRLRTDMNDKLDQLEKKMSSELRGIEEGINKEIDAHVTLANDILGQIEDLGRSLSECQKMREHGIVFIGVKKASSRASEYGNIIDNIDKDIHPTDIRFQPNGILLGTIQKVQSLGTITTNRPINTGHKRTSILNKPVQEKQRIDVKSNIVGCTFMSDGHLVLACGNDGLKLFDKSFKLKDQSSGPVVDVSAINDTEVIVSQGIIKKLLRVRIFRGMVVKKTFKMDRMCLGVDVCSDKIYVTCHDNPGNGEVRVLNMDGKLQRRFGVDNGKYMFTRPDYVKVNSTGSKVFISDGNTHTVTCLNTQGHVIYQYADRDLKEPTGMYVDAEDNLLLCGVRSHNVHEVRRDGGKERIVLSQKDGIQYPWCLSYRESDGCLVAATDKKLVIYSTR